MSLLFMEGFDNIATADSTGKAWAYNNVTISSSYSRNASGQGIRINGSGSYLQRAFTGDDVIIVGFAFQVLTGSTGYDVLLFRNDTTAHVSIGWSPTYKRLDAWSGLFGTLRGSTPTNSVLYDRWYYVEIKVYVHDSSGTIDIDINEASALALTGIDTRNGSSTTIDNVLFGTVTNAALGFVYLDDIYVLDNAGSAPLNDMLGDVTVQTIRPTAESACAWTPSTGTDNSALVDDTTPNSNTDYVESSSAGQQDIYVFSNLAANTSTVYGLQVCVNAIKDDAGARSIKILTKSGGTTDASSDRALSAASYITYMEVHETDPDTSAAWTVSGVNAAEFGQETV